MNKLQCPLCRQPYHQPNMCPHCSQVYCLQCIRTYLNKYYFCPSCDHHIIELVDCSRLINEVKEKIKQSDLKKSKQSLILTSQLCKQHSLPLKYHCLTCSTDICSDCGLISQKHISHNIKPLQTPQKNTITPSQLKQIKQKVFDKLHFFQQQQKRYILELELLKSQIKYNKTKIYEYYEELILRLQKQTQIILKDIQSKIHQCSKNINQRINIKQKLQNLQKIPHISQILNDQIVSLSVSNNLPIQILSIEITDRQFYQYLLDKNYLTKNQSKKNLEKRRSSRKNRNFLKKQNQYELQREQKSSQRSEKSLQISHTSLLFDKKIYELGIMKQIYPQYHNFSFQLDYSISKDQDTIYSPNFKVFGYEWRLKIYPKGNAQVFGEYLSVFLELINSPQALSSNTSKQYFFRLELLNLNQAGKSVIKEYNSKFSVGQCWGYAQFIELKELRDYLHDGKLLFVMGVKNTSYFDLCENMKKYISKLEGQAKILSELCENYYLGSNNSLQSQINHELGLNSPNSSDDEAQIMDYHVQSHHQLTEDEISSIISSFDDD